MAPLFGGRSHYYTYVHVVKSQSFTQNSLFGYYKASNPQAGRQMNKQVDIQINQCIITRTNMGQVIGRVNIYNID